MSNDSTELDPPVVIVGYQHSGTTVMLNILRNHPDVFGSPRETKFFQHIDAVVKRFPQPDDRPGLERFCREIIAGGFPAQDFPTPRARRAAHGRREAARVWAAVFDEAAASAGKRRWVEKTPAHVFHAEQIWEAAPEARFIELVRDPRDVLASKKTRRDTVWTTDRYRPQDRPRKHLEKSFDPVWDAMSWRSAIRAGSLAAARRPDQWLRVRYEDLATDPEGVIRSAFDFLGLSYLPSVLDVRRVAAADHRQPEANEIGVGAASVGRWRGVLDDDEVGVCQRLCRAEMNTFEYQAEAGLRTGLAKTLVRRSAPDLARRVVHRARLGGPAYARSVVRGYFRRLRTLMPSRR